MLEIPFTPVLPPISHQETFLRESARRPFYALFWEQGTGKTKALIDNVALLAMVDDLSGCFVLAPNGVHRNWHVEELPKHWPKDAPEMRSMAWNTQKSGSKAHKEEFYQLMTFPGLAFLCMSYDGMLTDAGKKASWDFLRKRKVMYIADESQRFKTPGAKRTKTVIASSVYAPYRRIASGTPMDKPFDIYSQVRFLNADHWVRKLSLGSFSSFKTYFAEWKQQTLAGGRSYPMLMGYKNLDQMNDSIQDMSSRVMKEDVLDLPSKVYKRMFHELTQDQRRAYDELKEDALTFMGSGELITAEFALTLQLKLSQIGCGFMYPFAGGEPVYFKENPRGELLRTILEDLERPAIIWCNFRPDMVVCREASLAAGRRPVVFDGDHPERSLLPFHSGEADDLIGNLSSGLIEGHTLNEADTTIYYSRSPKIIARLQSEDRNHRIGQIRSVTYIDLLAERTLDRKTLSDLKTKREHGGTVLGDNMDRIKAWLTEALTDE